MHYQVIIIPYRDRQEHLRQFLHHMQNYNKECRIKICIVEQADDKPFNRGKLLNIGALQCPALHYIMHDVDMLPINCTYEPSPHAEVVQFASSKIQLNDYLGGVTMFTHNVFYKVGGYNNEYFHRAEDNEMHFNLKRMRIPVLNDFREFKQLPHKRNSNEFISALWYRAQEKRKVQDQLYTCAYTLLTKDIADGIVHLKVDL